MLGFFFMDGKVGGFGFGLNDGGGGCAGRGGGFFGGFGVLDFVAFSLTGGLNILGCG